MRRTRLSGIKMWALLAGGVAAAVTLVACSPLPFTGDLAKTAVDTAGYEIEPLPVVISASYARGDDVYLGASDGHTWKASDSRLDAPWTDLGNPLGTGPRLLFASREGVLFTGVDHQAVQRSDDGGATWNVCLDTPVWRMDEDDAGDLFAGEYVKDPQHIATLFKSTDAGRTWNVVFTDPQTQHIHTVRWDDRAKRLYIAFGDGSARGTAYSDDRGASFQILVRSPDDGPTDIAIARDHLFSFTDVGSGQIIRVGRTGGIDEVRIDSQSIWFGVARDEQVFVGTMTTTSGKPVRSALLATANQGGTWQKLAETELSTGPYSRGYYAESRELSAAGWLYYTSGDGDGTHSYRVRRTPY